MVRVIRQPTGILDGLSLSQYRVGQTYELNPALAEFLVVQGFAVFEMRRAERSHRIRWNDRRRST